jgi:hypothetical protein
MVVDEDQRGQRKTETVVCKQGVGISDDAALSQNGL